MQALTYFVNRTPSLIFDAISSFFMPIRGVRGDVDKLANNTNYEIDDLYVPLTYVKILQEAACYNQGAFTQYWYIASRKHRELRKVIDCSQSRESKISEARADLYSFLNQEFHEAALINFKLLHKYFNNRSDTPPRICIKGYFKTHNKEEVITVFRDREVSYEGPTSKGENSGFEAIAETGKYYLCNNIFKSALKGEYKNPRLDIGTIAKYRKNPFLRLETRKNIFSIWKKKDKENPKENIYNSTLIIPMTFWNNDLRPDFLNTLHVLPEKKRTIMGLLCIDHIDANYFKRESDIPIVYSFADILSQYLFARLAFTDISETEKVAKSILLAKEKKMQYSPEKIKRIAADILSDRSQAKSISQIKSSSKHENHLFTLDKNLVEYSKMVQEFSLRNIHEIT